MPGLRVRANALDLALYRRARLVARTPQTVEWVRRFSTLGEHGAGAIAAADARPAVARDR